MPDKIIAFVNRKGGVGKTTSAAYVAMCLHSSGSPVTGIDADPDKSFLKWHSTGVLPYEVREVDRSALAKQIKSLPGIVVIDTAPNDPEIIYEVGDLADELIVPLAATGLDVNRLATTLKAVARVEKMRNRPLSSVLLVKWSKTQNISREVQQTLEDEGLPLLESKIRDLTTYKSFDRPDYLEEYRAVLTELEVL